MRALLIVNPHATSTNERRRDLLAHALAGEMSLQVAHTESRGHAAAPGRGGRGQRCRCRRRARRRRHRQRGRQRPDVPRRPAGHAAARGRARRVDERLRQGARHRSGPDRGHRADPRGAGQAAAPGRCPSAGPASATSPSTPVSGLDAEAVHAVEERRHAGSAISNAMHVRMTVSPVLPIGSAASPADPGTAGPGADHRRAHGVRLECRPVDLLRQRPVRTNPGTVHLDRSRGVCADQHGSADRYAGGRRDPDRPRPGNRRRSSARTTSRGQPFAAANRSDMQADGDYLGKKTEMGFTSVPNALRLVL